MTSRDLRPRRAKTEALARIEDSNLASRRVDREIEMNRYEEDDETRARERERLRGLQLVHLRCSATTRAGTICKRSAPHVVNGCNLCTMHKVIRESHGRMPPRQKRKRDDIPAHARRIEHVVFVEPDETQCTICFAPMAENEMTLTNCGHVFHEACLRRWRERQTTCPKCRKHTNAFRGASDTLILAKLITPKSFC